MKVTAFEIIAIPATDTFAIREKAFRRRHPELAGLLPLEGAVASELRTSSLVPKGLVFDDCASLGAPNIRSANALRALLDRRGWEYREYAGEYQTSNHGQWISKA